MKFRKNHALQKKLTFDAFKNADSAGIEMIENVDMDSWQSPAIFFSRMSTSGFLNVHPSKAYDEARDLLLAYVGDHTMNTAKENKLETIVARVLDNIQFEIRVTNAKAKNIQVRIQPVKTNVLSDNHDFAVETIRKKTVILRRV